MMKKFHTIVLYFMMLAPMTFQCVRCEKFFIVTTSESPACFESDSSKYTSLGADNNDRSFYDKEFSCLTLQQFVGRFTDDSYQNLSNITLELDSGEHSLDSTLSIFNITAFEVSSDTAATTVICSKPGVGLQLHSIEDVVISGTTFVGCKEIEISFVDQFRFENSSLQSSSDGSLILNHTLNATVTGSSITEISQRQCDRAAIIISNSSVLVQLCTFFNSKAGTIYSTHSVIVIDSCTFVNNSLMSCGQDYDATPMITAINGPRTTKRVTITNSDFIDNHEAMDHPVYLIFIDGSTLVQNNTFVDNNALRLFYISTEYNEIIIDHNYVYNNKAAAICIDSSDTSIIVSNNNFTDNFGTAVVMSIEDATVTVNDSYFFGNTDRYGQQENGAITISYINQPPCPFNVSVIIARCTFAHNYPPQFEHKLFRGAVSVCTISGPVLVMQSTFIDNLDSYFGGGALKINTVTENSGSIVIDSCTFIENKSSTRYGGAIHIFHAASILINNVNFTSNQGSLEGGAALHMEVDNAIITINDSYFYGNINTRLNWTHDKSYYGYGGTVHLQGSSNSLMINRSSFVNNAVDVLDGGIVNTDGSQRSVVILRSNFTNNTVTGPPYQLYASYGGLLISAKTVKIADSIFFNNSAENCGALSMQVSNIHISNCYFLHNSAVHYSGGAICIFHKLKQMLISNSTFSHNYAKNDGGVLKMKTYDGYATIKIRGSTFDNNSAGLQGGVFWTFPLDYGSFYISDSSFINNRAGSDGGVMAMKFEDNDYSKVYSQLIITGSTFDQNRAKVRGGVFSSFTPYMYAVENSSFTSNQAGTDGGVMFVESSKSLVRISDGSTFDFNNATGRGGVISINESRLEISNTTVFSDNVAVIGDDIIACNCDIKSTTAFIQHSYTDPSFPNCTIYGHYQVTTTDSNPKPTPGYVVAMAVSIPLGFIVIVTVLTATVLACWCYRRQYLQKQYRVRRSAHHPDFVPLMNDAFT